LSLGAKADGLREAARRADAITAANLESYAAGLEEGARLIHDLVRTLGDLLM